jgi:hypothetical protein
MIEVVADPVDRVDEIDARVAAHVLERQLGTDRQRHRSGSHWHENITSIRPLTGAAPKVI